MTLSEIRRQLATRPVLSYQQFMATDGYHLEGTAPNDSDIHGRWDLMANPIKSQVHYLHYLCFMGQPEPIKAYVRGLGGRAAWMLNHTDIYEHYFGSPLHTFTCWNNCVATTQFLVESGADPNLVDYYGARPGRDTVSTWYIPSFRVGCELDNFSNDPDRTECCLRTADDLSDTWKFLDSLQKGIQIPGIT
jgi:hypothetical protein